MSDEGGRVEERTVAMVVLPEEVGPESAIRRGLVVTVTLGIFC